MSSASKNREFYNPDSGDDSNKKEKIYYDVDVKRDILDKFSYKEEEHGKWKDPWESTGESISKGFSDAGKNIKEDFDFNKSMKDTKKASKDFDEAFGRIGFGLGQLEGLGDDLNQLDVIATNLASDYLADKWNRLVDLYKSTTSVSVKSLLDDCAALTIGLSSDTEMKKKYGYPTENFWDRMVDRLDDLVAYILGVNPSEDGWSGLGENLFSDFASYAGGNEEFTNAVGSLQTVQSFVNTLTGVMEVIDVVMNIVDALEPVMPIIEILADLGASLLNPAMAGKAANEITTVAQEAVYKATGIAVVALKNYLFNIKIDVPTVVIGSLKTFNISSDYGFTSEHMEDVLNSWAGDDPLRQQALKGLEADSLQDLYKVNVEQNITSGLSGARNKLDSWRRFQFGNADPNRKNDWLYEGVSDIMQGISDKAVAAAESLKFKVIPCNCPEKKSDKDEDVLINGVFYRHIDGSQSEPSNPDIPDDSGEDEINDTFNEESPLSDDEIRSHSGKAVSGGSSFGFTYEVK